MEPGTALFLAKVADALRDRRTWVAIGCILMGVIFLIIVPFSMAGSVLSAVFALLNPQLLGDLEDDLHYQAIQEVKAEKEIDNDLNVYTLKIIDLLHHHDLMRDKGEIKAYIEDYFVLEEEVVVEEEDETVIENPEYTEGEGTEDTPVPGESGQVITKIIYKFKTPDEIMEMVTGPPFYFGEEELEAIRQLVYMPPTTDEIVFNGKFPMPCNGYISSPFGYRIDPITGKSSYHSGIDIVPAHHAPLIAIAEGTVVAVHNTYGAIYGNTITIKHEVDGQTFYTFYAHCSSIVAAVGAKVKQFDVVAYEGGDQKTDPNPGRTTGAHLHFEIRLSQGGNEVDPLRYLSGK